MPTTLMAPPPDVEAVRRGIAEQVAPLVAARAALGTRWDVTFEEAAVRRRVDAGIAALDPAAVIRSAGDLRAPIALAAAAMEEAGLVPNAHETQSCESHESAVRAVAVWLGGDAAPTIGRRGSALSAGALVGAAILRHAAEAVRAVIDLASWTRTYCPCCGGRPDLSARIGAGRGLTCGWCDTTWRTPVTGCLRCGAATAPTVGSITATTIGYRVAICHFCSRYLKECAHALPGDPLVERILTADLDRAAQRRGLRV